MRSEVGPVPFEGTTGSDTQFVTNKSRYYVTLVRKVEAADHV